MNKININIMTTRSIALKRISNDLKELAKSPLEGVGIAPMVDDPMKYVINMEYDRSISRI